jgi:hypothetical protein
MVHRPAEGDAQSPEASLGLLEAGPVREKRDA